MATTEAEAFYSDLNDEVAMSRLIDDGVREGIHLEFKQKKNRSHGKLDDSDAWQFSRALSGFANSDGGVLVWGVETGKNDEAINLKPISQHEDFRAALQKSILNSTQPVVDGVRLESIPSIADSEIGYVKCLIPTSDKTSHRALRADREYYRRTSEGFYRLEHFDLEDMFGRRPRPRLSLEYRVEGAGHGGPRQYERDFRVVLSVRNIGRGSASAPFIALTVSDYEIKAYGLSANSALCMIFSDDPHETTMRFVSKAEFVIHPGVAYEMAAIGGNIHDAIHELANLTVTCYLAAENSQLTNQTIVIDQDELFLAVGRNIHR